MHKQSIDLMRTDEEEEEEVFWSVLDQNVCRQIIIIIAILEQKMILFNNWFKLRSIVQCPGTVIILTLTNRHSMKWEVEDICYMKEVRKKVHWTRVL